MRRCAPWRARSCSRSSSARKLSWPSFFFFSSRRRHTRWPRDWSSDVCSCDLFEQDGEHLSQASREILLTLALGYQVNVRLLGQRSEERRVGKECRSRWSPSN